MKTRASPERRARQDRALYQLYRATRTLDRARDAIPRNVLTTLYCLAALSAGAGVALGVYLLTAFAWLSIVLVLASAYGLRRLNTRLERHFTASAARIHALEVDLGMVEAPPEAPVTALGEALKVVQAEIASRPKPRPKLMDAMTQAWFEMAAVLASESATAVFLTERVDKLLERQRSLLGNPYPSDPGFENIITTGPDQNALPPAGRPNPVGNARRQKPPLPTSYRHLIDYGNASWNCRCGTNNPKEGKTCWACETPRPCRRGHKWETQRSTSLNTYQQCMKCHARRTKEAPVAYGYTPLDTQWLNGGDWFNPLTQMVFEPEQKASGVAKDTSRELDASTIAFLRHAGPHWWTTVRSTDAYSYQQCQSCAARQWFAKSHGGYQPLDTQWLNGGEWSAETTRALATRMLPCACGECVRLAAEVEKRARVTECQHNWQFIVRTDGVLIGKRCRDCGWWEQ